ncbi:hypothetical protein GVN20_27825 [Runella sp. CRIBMP]|uniref:hypothetical protein n=1 Tax=Runella sp. CRIBMP TaxID=2683261 RepID=UPI001412CBE5|nr:hypothetical protein [Runella sp. CRIBMP]NBB23192.1 hypothetical protein [Runella sp. CRIBMP]
MNYNNSNWYLMQYSITPTIVGVKDGMPQAKIEKEGFAKESSYENIINWFSSFENRFKIPIYRMYFECIKMKKFAKLTDFISLNYISTCVQFAVSPKAVHTLKQYEINFELYDCQIYYRNSIINDYKVLYLPFLDLDNFDIENSVFYTGSFITKDKQYLKIKNKEDYLSVKYAKKAEKLKLGKIFDENTDMFNSIFGGIIVSKRLKDAILKIGITGIEFNLPDKPMIE